MRKSILVIIAAYLLILISPVFVHALPEDPAKGGLLLAGKGCLKCHSIKGVGGTIGPDLGVVDLGDTGLDLAAKMWNHTPAMIEGMKKAGIVKPTLTAEEFSQITAYLYFLRFKDVPGNANAGRYLFGLKGCSSCHPVSGKGREGERALDDFPRNISPVFLSQAIWNHSLQMMAQMLRAGRQWPTFDGTEMMDILAFIRSYAKGQEEPALSRPGNPVEGRRIFEKKECVSCHSVFGEGPAGGIDLGRRAEAFYKSPTQIASDMWNNAPEMLLVRIARSQITMPRFTSNEMADVLAYLYSLHYVGGPGNAEKGEALFSKLRCSQCHRVGGKGGKLIYIDLSKLQNQDPSEIVADIWDHSMQMRKLMGIKGIPWPQLKKGDMADLVQYIRNPQNKKKQEGKGKN